LAGRVLLKFVYSLVRQVLGLAVLMFRGDGAKEAELLVLRHENAVLRRCAGRVRYDPVGAESPVTSCDLGIFMDQAAEPVPAQDPDIRAHSGQTLTPGGLYVPKTSSASCDQAIFVDQPTDTSLSSDAALTEIDRLG
jgi:hypothetical protein